MKLASVSTRIGAALPPPVVPFCPMASTAAHPTRALAGGGIAQGSSLSNQPASTAPPPPSSVPPPEPPEPPSPPEFPAPPTEPPLPSRSGVPPAPLNGVALPPPQPEINKTTAR